MWLECQPPPAMACSGAGEGRRPLVTFVPVNDSNEQEQLKGAKGNQRLVVFQPISETVGVRRDRKPRRFPSAAPDDPVEYHPYLMHSGYRGTLTFKMSDLESMDGKPKPGRLPPTTMRLSSMNTAGSGSIATEAPPC